MNKIYSFSFKKRICLLILFGGVINVGFAQTIQQRNAISAKSNLKELRRIEKHVSEKTPKVSELRKKAKEIGVKYTGTYNNNKYQFSGIYKDGVPRYLQTYNAGAAQTTNTNMLYKEAGIFDLTGRGMTVGEWDGGGVSTTHVELVGRVTQKDTPEEIAQHATHVAGTMIATGIIPKARGMAYQANLDAYDWNYDVSEMTSAAANGLLLSNHSYGFSGGFVYGNYAGTPGWYWLGSEDEIEFKGFGRYDSTDALWDDVMYNAPYYLAVKSAGNSRGDGPESGGRYFASRYNSLTGATEWFATNTKRPKNGGKDGFDCITYGTTGKNLLVIGAAEKIIGGYTKPSDVKIASFSSFGPTDDGRIKPDIVGAGVDLLSSSSESPQSYAVLSGTSMSSPNVTGSLLLLQQHYSELNGGNFMRAATLKALILNTANEAGDAPGPDYKYGFGLLNTFEAARAISTANEYSILKEDRLEQGGSNVFKVKAAGNAPLKITLAWQDPALDISELPDPNILNNRKKVLVNDLDIVVEKDGELFYPWKLNPEEPNAPATKGVNDVDNVEQIVIENPEPKAEYTIRIIHKSNTLKGGGQDYSIVATGLALAPVKDISIDNLEIKADRAAYSEATPVAVTLSSFYDKVINGAKIKYTLLNKDTDIIEEEGTLDVNNLAAGEIRTVDFNIDLSHSFVNYELKAEVEYDQDKVLVNNTKIVSAYGTITDLTKRNARLNYGFEKSLEEQGWSVENKNSDARKWFIFKDRQGVVVSRTGSGSLVKITNNNVPDAWVYSNPLKLKGGQTYKVIYFARNSKSFNDKFRVAYGKTPDGAEMTPIGEEVSLKTGWFIRYNTEFTPTEDGIYYVGFHNYTNNNDMSYSVLMDDVTIMNANGKPYVDFSAQYYRPSTFETDTLRNESISGPEIISYEWNISPNTVEFLGGTTRNSENPIVRFTGEGYYNIKLKATNIHGEEEETKNNFIKVANVPVEAAFKASNRNIYDNNKIQLVDYSTGRPFPNKWNWEITPSTDVYFVDGTTKNSEAPIVLFGREGHYTVKLEVASDLGEKTLVKQDFIEVKGKHYPVNNLGYRQRVNRIDLNWDRPTLRAVYNQSFENGGIMPDKVRLFDEDGDGSNWYIESDKTNVSDGNYSAKSLSKFKSVNPNDTRRDVKNWLVTGKIKSGGEELRLDVKTNGYERFKVYVVPANKIQKLSEREIKIRGVKIFEFNAQEKIENFKRLSFDINRFKGQDIYVAILHCTKKTDDGVSLIIDNIQVGFKNIENRPKETVNSLSSKEEIMTFMKPFHRDYLETFKSPKKQIEADEEDNKKEVDNSPWPELIGYEVVRNGESLKTIKDMNETNYVDILSESKNYDYDIYALYSDGKKSIQQSVSVDAMFVIPILEERLDRELHEGGIVIYPNPTNGIFNVKLPKGVMSCKLALYDLTGKLIFTKENVIEQEPQSINYLKSGVYILKIEDDKGGKASFKIIKK